MEVNDDDKFTPFWEEFENKILNLFKKMNFEYVNGGRTFSVAPTGRRNQIDVCVRYNHVLLVGECKAQGRRSKKSMRNDIAIFQKKIKMLKEGLSNTKELAGITHIIPFFITSRIDVTDNDIEDLNEQKIKYFDEKFLEYYIDLYVKIGEYAKYNLLADFGCLSGRESHLTIAIRSKLGEKTAFLFFANPKELLKFAYVARRGQSNEEFYQREISPVRLRSIAQFIDAGGSFPNSIIISIRGHYAWKKISNDTNLKDIQNENMAQFSNVGSFDVGTLRIEDMYHSCWIVDGQHRLFGLAKSNKNVNIPCVAFPDLRFEQEREFFKKINEEQKKIPSDLLWDLEGQIDKNGEKIKGQIANIVYKINELDPLKDKVYIPKNGPKHGKKLTIGSLCRAIFDSKLLVERPPNLITDSGIEKNPLFLKEFPRKINTPADVISRYLCSINESSKLNEELNKFLLGNAGLAIIFEALTPYIVYLSYSERRIPENKDFKLYCEYIYKYFNETYGDSYDLKKLKAETNSAQGRALVVGGLREYLKSKVKDGKFWHIGQDPIDSKSAAELERRLAEFVVTKLSAEYEKWENGLAQGARDAASKRMRQSAGENLEEFLDMEDIKDTVLKKDNFTKIFQSIFIPKYYKGIEALTAAFEYLIMLRNPLAHAREIKASEFNPKFAKLHLRLFQKILAENSET